MATITALLPTVPSDDQLLKRLAEGDARALEELFERYRGLAYRVAHRLLGNEADALDAVQEGFVKVLLNLGGFQGRSSFKTWLMRVISNAALDLGRKRGRRETLSLHCLPGDVHDHFQPLEVHNATQELERADLRLQLDQALATLPAPQRQTFVLHADGELTYREVAQALGISIGTVMSRLYYARQKLRAVLTPWIHA